jgi:hypothetical protein
MIYADSFAAAPTNVTKGCGHDILLRSKIVSWRREGDCLLAPKDVARPAAFDEENLK